MPNESESDAISHLVRSRPTLGTGKIGGETGVTSSAPDGAPVELDAGAAESEASSDLARRLGPEAIPERLKRHAHWRGQAAVQLQQFQTAVLPGLVGDARRDQLRAARQLQQAIARSHEDSSVLLGRQGRWHGALKEAERAVTASETLLTMEGAASQPQVQRSFATSHLQLGYARFMLEGNSPKLRQDLLQAHQRFKKSEGLAKWTAHYHVMVGQMATARDVLVPVLDRKKIQPRLSALKALVYPQEARAQEQAYPCNFYTYRYELVSDEVLETMGYQVNVAATWDPASVSAEAMAKSVAEEARAAELARSAAQDQSRATDDLYGDQEYDAGGWVEELAEGKKIYSKPKRRPTYNPALSAAQKASEAYAAALKATTAAVAIREAMKAKAGTAQSVRVCLTAWNAAIRAFRHQNYAGAILYFRDCRVAALRYLSMRYAAKNYAVPNTEDGVYSQLCQVARDMLTDIPGRAVGAANQLLPYWKTRYSIEELEGSSGGMKRFDWVRPTRAFHLKEDKLENPLADATDLLTLLVAAPQQVRECEKLEEKVDAPLLTLALVHVSFGIAEAQRLSRDFDRANSELGKLLARHADFKLLSQVIEVPFVALLRARTLLEKGDAQYKVGDLDAANTYRGVLDCVRASNEGQYLSYLKRIDDGIASYKAKLDELLKLQLHPLSGQAGGAPINVQQRQQLRTLAEVIPIRSVFKAGPTTRPLQPLLRYELENGQQVQETNPVVYSLIAQVKAKLTQIEAGLNYLGYQDEYVPPWRFNFLLERARYFAEHAKAAQRDYLNFLANAEREEERETSARQAVVLAKGNLSIAQSRAEKGRSEVELSKSAKELADLASSNATTRAADYARFDLAQDALAQEIQAGATGRQAEAIAGGALAGIGTGAAIGGAIGSVIPGLGTLIGAAAGAIVGGLIAVFSSADAEAQRSSQLETADLHRATEQAALERAAKESQASAVVAQRQLTAARSALLVSALEWAADLMNHEFSQQNYSYLVRRQLSAEQWFRLAHDIRCVADRYLRYAVEMAFLAEQAYEFEVDKRINVIRFDYDASDTASALAGDFLLADLNTLEQDLIVTRQRREQSVRFVVSMARDYPDALQQLRRDGSTFVPLTLDRLERRFPGLFNLRVGAVEMLPVALMDPTRFSVQLTYTGAGQVRTDQPVDLSGRPDTLPYVQSWVAAADTRWPVKMQIGQVETAVFSGLSRVDQQSSLAAVMGGQRDAFERLPAAAVWHVAMSMKENRVLPGSLADMLITFTLSGVHDAALQEQVEKAVPSREVLTRWFSTSQSFPDAFYEFNQSGKLVLPITRERLSLTGRVENLRNFGFVLVPSQDEPLFNALTAAAALEFKVSSAGVVTVLTPSPKIEIAVVQLQLTATVNLPGAQVQWDLGDGSAPIETAQIQHTYRRAGRYVVTLRLTWQERLLEYTAAVVMSVRHAVRPPLVMAVESLVATRAANGTLDIQAAAFTGNENVSGTWRLGERPPNTTGTFSGIEPERRYTVVATAARSLSARIYSRQRWKTDVPITITGLGASTNRTFDDNGSPNNVAQYNDLARHLFGPGPLGPVDSWTIELPINENTHLRTVDPLDESSSAPITDRDVWLAVEYDVAFR